jgi:hypothetical protein
MGRPSDYTEEKGTEICRLLATGRSLRSICLQDDMPNFDTVLRWAERFPSFRGQYAEARSAQAELWAEEIVDIADGNKLDTKLVARGDELVETLDWDHVQRAKLRVDARKWIAARLLPKKYGDTQNLRVSGPDGGPIQTQTQHSLAPEDMSLFLQAMTDAERRKGSPLFAAAPAAAPVKRKGGRKAVPKPPKPPRQMHPGKTPVRKPKEPQ